MRLTIPLIGPWCPVIFALTGWARLLYNTGKASGGLCELAGNARVETGRERSQSWLMKKGPT